MKQKENGMINSVSAKYNVDPDIMIDRLKNIRHRYINILNIYTSKYIKFNYLSQLIYNLLYTENSIPSLTLHSSSLCF